MDANLLIVITEEVNDQALSKYYFKNTDNDKTTVQAELKANLAMKNGRATND